MTDRTAAVAAAKHQAPQRACVQLGDEEKSHPRVRMALARARAAVTLERLKAWDESQHPREPAGSSAGGQFAGGDGGGESSATDSKPKKKVEAGDFTKDEVFLDTYTHNKPEKFLATWEQYVGEPPAAFKKEFLGGMPGSMSIRFHENLGAITVMGQLHDAQGNPIGDYTRDIDLDDHKASSSYFKLHRGDTGKGVGKKLLAANVEMYKKMGVESVRVHANIDVGGYAWAKYGYVPTKADWPELAEVIDRNIRRMSSGGGGDGDGYRAESWEELSDYQQRQVFEEFIRQTEDEFRDSEVDNWRDSGQSLDDAKVSIAERYPQDSDWAQQAIDGYRAKREEEHKPPIPFSNEQLIKAIDVEYSSDGEGGGSLEITFDDDKLQHPEGYKPDQPTLPGIEHVEPHEYLTEEMRDELDRALNKSFDNEGSEKEGDIDPPDFSDSIREFQRDVWEGYGDNEKFQWAERHAQEHLGGDEDSEPAGSGDISDEDANRLHRLTASDDPKAIWAIADSQWGKDLLLGTDWNGVIDFKDKESMDRFNAYVGKK
jgi:ribosomal protein S18 acetylase RimI-like enzyme